jgi:glycosyltransferase involved in cell wall biosynthesis
MTESSRPLISVMITVYNGARYLREAIDSVLTQTYEPVELVVVDDGSDDESAAIAKSYGSRLRLHSQPRGGMGASRNTAVEFASGSFFAFLDADDRFLPDKLARQMDLFEADPELDIVFGHMSEFVSPDLDEATKALLRAPASNVAWRTPNLMLVKRESFTRVGGFSSTLKVGIGVDWFARATEAGLKTAVPPVVVLERRLHADNNGIRERDSRPQYLHVLKAAVERRRQGPGGEPTEDVSTPRPIQR